MGKVGNEPPSAAMGRRPIDAGQGIQFREQLAKGIGGKGGALLRPYHRLVTS